MWTGVAFTEYQHSPDPLIFDGSQLPPEKQSTSSLAKIIQKRPKIGIPGQFNSEGKQQQSQGVEGKETPKHQNGESKGDQTSEEGKEGEEGSGMGDESEMIDEASEGAVGGELAEVDEAALAESEEREGMGAGGEESQEGEQGGMSSAESMEGEMGESSGKPILSNIGIGAPSEMIDVVEMENDGSEGMDTNAESNTPKKPMIGKNKGQSLGMEEGDRIPSDI